MSYAVTKNRALQYIGIILIIGVFAGAYWYFQVFAGVKTNTSLTDPLSEGLAGYWKLDEGTGTSATDSSTNGNTGTLTNGPTWTTGQIGGAVTFDNVNDYIDLGDVSTMEGQSALTISTWINPTTLANYDGIVSKYASATSDTTLNLGGTGVGTTSSLVATIRNGSDTYGYTATGKIVTGVWTHCILVFDGTQTGNSNRLKVYINGVSEALTFVGTIPATTVANAQNLRIGRTGSASDYFDGKIDEVRVYNRALSAEEVAQLYRVNSPTGVDTNLKGYWTFDGTDTTSTTATDRSGAGNNGTLTNSPAITEGKVGQALNFFPNGSDADTYVTMGDPSSGALDFGSGDFSVGFWTKGLGYSSQGSSVNVVLSKKNTDSAGSAGYAFRYTSSNQMLFLIGNGTTDYTITAPATTASDSQWHYYIGSRSGNTIYLYIDGVLAGSTSVTGSVSSSIGLFVGSDGNSLRNANANIDEVRVYSAALTAAQIQSLYKAGESDVMNVTDTNGNLNSGLAGYWALNEGTGTSTVDSSINGNTGTLTGAGGVPTWTTGQIGSAVDFDGTDDYISVSDSDALSPSTISVALWSKSDVTTSKPVYVHRLNDSNRVDIFVGSDIYCTFGNGTTYNSGSYSSTWDTNWHHVVCAWDGTTVSTYLDGALVKAESFSGTLPNINSSVQIGRRGSTATYFDGSIDEVRVYSRAISATEVAQLYRYTGPAAADSGLVGHWSFNGTDTTSTKAYDRSGAGNTGTLSGPAIAEGKVGQGLLFDGVDDGVNLDNPSALQSLTDFSMAAWIYVDSDRGASVDYIVSQYDGGGIADGDFLWYVNTNDTLIVNIDGATAAVTSSVITENEWHYVALTVDGDNRMDLYVDGTLNVSDTAIGTTAPYLHNANDLKIGSMHAGINPFQGIIDEVRIYNSILTAAQIQSLYKQSQSDEVNTGASQAQGTGRLDSGLAGYWPMDNGSGTSATDLSTNGNTGTLSGATGGLPAWTTGQIGSSVSFDGTDDIMTVSAGTGIVDASQNITIAVWIYPRATSPHSTIAAKSAVCDETGSKYMFELVGGVPELWMGGTRGTSSGITIPNDQWSYLVVTNDSAGRKFYVNGGLGYSGTALPAPTSSSADWRFGWCNAFNGNMDEVRIYNRALSTDEVGQLYRLNAPTGTDTGLKGYWSFNGRDMSGTTAYDRSGAGNTGTLTNGPAVTEGKLGQGLSFDGVNDYVNLGVFTPFQFANTTFTVTGWFKSGPADTGGVFVAQGGSGAGWFVGLNNNTSGMLSAVIKNSDGGQSGKLSTQGGFNDNIWHHFTFVMTTNTSAYASNNSLLYADGVLLSSSENSDSTSGGYATSSVVASLGVRNAGSSLLFKGSLDEVRIYNRALTAAEIKSLYNASR